MAGERFEVGADALCKHAGWVDTIADHDTGDASVRAAFSAGDRG